MKQKFFLQTYGCKSNQADSEIIRGVLLKKFQEASEKEADFVVINSCGVIQKTENNETFSNNYFNDFCFKCLQQHLKQKRKQKNGK